MFGLNMYSLVLGRAFIMAIVLALTLIILGRLPFTGWFILIVRESVSTSIYFSLAASIPLAPVSFQTCSKVAVFSAASSLHAYGFGLRLRCLAICSRLLPCPTISMSSRISLAPQDGAMSSHSKVIYHLKW